MPAPVIFPSPRVERLETVVKVIKSSSVVELRTEPSILAPDLVVAHDPDKEFAAV